MLIKLFTKAMPMNGAERGHMQDGDRHNDIHQKKRKREIKTS